MLLGSRMWLILWLRRLIRRRNCERTINAVRFFRLYLSHSLWSRPLWLIYWLRQWISRLNWVDTRNGARYFRCCFFPFTSIPRSINNKLVSVKSWLELLAHKKWSALHPLLLFSSGSIPHWINVNGRRHSKICPFHCNFLLLLASSSAGIDGDEHICRFDILMDDIFRMNVLETWCQLWENFKIVWQFRSVVFLFWTIRPWKYLIQRCVTEFESEISIRITRKYYLEEFNLVVF